MTPMPSDEATKLEGLLHENGRQHLQVNDDAGALVVTSVDDEGQPHTHFKLSPKGKLVDRFLRLTAKDFDRGTPFTPVAFLVDHAHGWEPAPFWPVLTVCRSLLVMGSNSLMTPWALMHRTWPFLSFWALKM